jgi:hypothetical protein
MTYLEWVRRASESPYSELRQCAERALRLLHKAGQGNVRALQDWYVSGEGAEQIRWGTEGDLTRCHAIASKYMDSDQAWGFCQERAHDAMGHYNSPKD